MSFPTATVTWFVPEDRFIPIRAAGTEGTGVIEGVSTFMVEQVIAPQAVSPTGDPAETARLQHTMTVPPGTAGKVVDMDSGQVLDASVRTDWLTEWYATKGEYPNATPKAIQAIITNQPVIHETPSGSLPTVPPVVNVTSGQAVPVPVSTPANPSTPASTLNSAAQVKADRAHSLIDKILHSLPAAEHVIAHELRAILHDFGIIRKP